GYSVTVDTSRNAYVGGNPTPPSAPPGMLTASLAASGTTQGYYVAKFDSAGFPTQTTVTGASPEAIALGPDKSIYIAGSDPRDFKTVNAFQPTPGGPQCSGTYCVGLEGFAARLTPDGTAYMWSTYLGGSGNDTITSIAADADGSPWRAGDATSHGSPTKETTRGRQTTHQTVQ